MVKIDGILYQNHLGNIFNIKFINIVIELLVAYVHVIVNFGFQLGTGTCWLNSVATRVGASVIPTCWLIVITMMAMSLETVLS